MSGGEYNYLYYKEPDELMQQTDDLQAMSDRLSGLGYADDAAAEVQNLLLTIRQYENRIRSMSHRLSDLMKAVEWWDSGDSREDEVKRALLEYRGEDCE